MLQGTRENHHYQAGILKSHCENEDYEKSVTKHKILLICFWKHNAWKTYDNKRINRRIKTFQSKI